MQDAAETLRRAVAATETDPHGGKVMIDLETARALLAALGRNRR